MTSSRACDLRRRDRFYRKTVQLRVDCSPRRAVVVNANRPDCEHSAFVADVISDVNQRSDKPT